MTETERKTWVVDESGAGDYRTLTEAVAACAATPDEPVRFYIRHGIYEERPFIELADYVIEGEYRNATVITASVGGRDPWPGEVKTGTFRSATLFLGGGRAVVRNLTVQNNAGDGPSSPTYPASVSVVASAMTNGTFMTFASVCAYFITLIVSDIAKIRTLF